jgi:RNase P/RNase MRP subunit POP5
MVFFSEYFSATFINHPPFHRKDEKKEEEALFFLKAGTPRTSDRMPRKLKPSMREHKRYVSYEILSERRLPNMNTIMTDHITRTLGIFDAAEAGIVPVSYDVDTQRGIFRVKDTLVAKAKVALLIAGQDVYGQRALARILAVSGNVKKVKFDKKISG